MNKNIKYALSLMALGLVGTACSTDTGGSLANGIGADGPNAVYMGNLNTSGTIAVLASDEAGAEFALTPRLARPASKDVEVTLEVDAETLASYNRANNLNVSPVGADDVVFTDSEGQEKKGRVTVVIKKGDIQAVVPARLLSLDKEKYPYGGRYAVPVRIAQVSDGHKLLSTPQTTIVNLNRKIKTSVFYLNTTGTQGYSQIMSPKTPYEGEMSEWTMQYMAQFSSLSNANMAGASMRGNNGFYSRLSQSAGIQIKSEGRDGTDTWTNKAIPLNQWIYVTEVYRKQGLAGQLAVYVNGELQQTFTTSLLYPSGPEGGWAFGNTNIAGYHLREFKFWSRALTPAEIQDKAYLPEDPASPGLECYFPFTKESYDEASSTFLDLTGKWTWSLHAGARFSTIENVSLPAKSVTIEP